MLIAVVTTRHHEKTQLVKIYPYGKTLVDAFLIASNSFDNLLVPVHAENERNRLGRERFKVGTLDNKLGNFQNSTQKVYTIY